jgi:WD40 repeat protein
VTALLGYRMGGQCRVAVGHGLGAIHLWDPEVGQLLRTLVGHTAEIKTIIAYETKGAATSDLSKLMGW